MEASAVEFSRTFLSRSTPAPLPTDPIRQYSPILIFQSPTCRIGIDQRTPSRHKPRRSIQPLRNRTNQINKQTNKQREIGKSLCVGASKQTATPSSERGAEHLPPFSSSHPPSPSLSLSLPPINDHYATSDVNDTPAIFRRRPGPRDYSIMFILGNVSVTGISAPSLLSSPLGKLRH